VIGPGVTIVSGVPEELEVFALKFTLGFAAIGRMVPKAVEGEEAAGCDIA
jgi:hypothetical protein